MSRQQHILLSFDVEEFEMPLEYQQVIPMQEQMEMGYKGLQATMQVIDATPVKATFFTTANFANQFPADIKALSGKHEIASHTYYHSDFLVPHLRESKEALETITGQPVYGLRMPRMRPVQMADVIAAGYQYDSSVNPTWIPGRYNNLHLSRTTYTDTGMLRLPASVSPHLRIPLFWLAFKNMPYSIFKTLTLQTLAYDGYVCLYFHPWEFIDISRYSIPGYAKRWSGEVLCERLHRLIKDLAPYGDFTLIREMLAAQKKITL
jgi:peptidoglycan/xylan/chitin deacetylase (PgdA/CDA1 family)